MKGSSNHAKPKTREGAMFFIKIKALLGNESAKRYINCVRDRWSSKANETAMRANYLETRGIDSSAISQMAHEYEKRAKRLEKYCNWL